MMAMEGKLEVEAGKGEEFLGGSKRLVEGWGGEGGKMRQDVLESREQENVLMLFEKSED